MKTPATIVNRYSQYNSHFDEVSFIMAYENGELSEDEVIEGFQHMLDNGHVWQLQGHYGRTAAALMDAGLIARHN